jgi:hypothetical protein
LSSGVANPVRANILAAGTVARRSRSIARIWVTQPMPPRFGMDKSTSKILPESEFILTQNVYGPTGNVREQRF